MGRNLAIALALACAAGLAGRAAAEEQRTFARLSVNGQDKADVLVILRDRDVLCLPTDLEAAGLRDLSGRRETFEGKQWVSLASLGDALSFEFDPKSVALRITARPEKLARTRVDFESSYRPKDLVFSSAPSVFLNYAAQTANGDRPSGSAELGGSVEGALLSSIASMRPDGTVVRGPTSLTLDSPSALRRIVLGDQLASGGQLGSSLLLGGLGVSREFSLDPYFVGGPRQDLSGVATTPSRIEVYSDGRLIRQESLPAGPFELANLPGYGTGDQTRIVVRDSFGRAQEFSGATRVAANLLAPGLSDYAYQVGFRRDALADANFGYGRPALLARHRLGLANWTTGGMSLEADRGVVSGGPSLTATSSIGAVELLAAGSTTGTSSGARLGAGYTFSSRLLGATAQLIWTSRRYANLALSPDQDRARIQLRLSASTSLGGLASVTGGFASAALRDGGTYRQVFVDTSARLFGPLTLMINGRIQQAQTHAPWTYLVFAGLNLALGNAMQASVSAQGDANQTSGVVQAQKALPPAGTGFGYNLSYATRPQDVASADVQYQGTYGRYEATYGRTPTAQSWTASAAGALVAINGSLFATRPVQDGFALIQVPGVEGVRGYLNNLEVGRTDASGDLLVPNVLPYYGNRLGITARDIPWSYNIGNTERTVAGPIRGGAIARFNVSRVQAFLGALEVRAGRARVVPANGEITLWVDGLPVTFPIGLQGQFYLENLSPGRYPADVAYAGKSCRLSLAIPRSEETLVDLGLIFCDEAPQLAAAPASSRGGGIVRGRVFLDVDGNGAWNPLEPVFEGVRVQLDGQQAVTDAEGAFVFTGAEGGTAPLRLAVPFDLPSGYAPADPEPAVLVPSGGQEVEVSLAIRRVGPLQDAGIFLLLPIAKGTLRLKPLQTARFPLDTWLGPHELSRSQESMLERLGNDVLDAPDLRVLVVSQAPPGALREGYSKAVAAGRAVLNLLQGPALVPRSRLIWTITDAPERATAGHVEVLLVRIERARVGALLESGDCCVASHDR